MLPRTSTRGLYPFSFPVHCGPWPLLRRRSHHRFLAQPGIDRLSAGFRIRLRPQAGALAASPFHAPHWFGRLLHGLCPHICHGRRGSNGEWAGHRHVPSGGRPAHEPSGRGKEGHGYEPFRHRRPARFCRWSHRCLGRSLLVGPQRHRLPDDPTRSDGGDFALHAAPPHCGICDKNAQPVTQAGNGNEEGPVACVHLPRRCPAQPVSSLLWAQHLSSPFLEYTSCTDRGRKQAPRSPSCLSH